MAPPPLSPAALAPPSIRLEPRTPSKHDAGWSAIDFHAIAQASSLTPAASSSSAAAPPRVDFLSGLPSDCLYSVLLLLDGCALAAVSSCSVSLARVGSGAELEGLWRDAARNDVRRLSYLERKCFEVPDNTTTTEFEDDTNDRNVNTATDGRAKEAAARAARLAQSPRALYLMRLKQHAAARAASRAEAQRIRLVRVRVRADERALVHTELVLDTVFLVGVPVALLVAGVLLLAAEHIGHAWPIFVPLWTATLATAALLVVVANLRERERRQQALLAPPAIAASPTSASSAISSFAFSPSSSSATGASAAPGSPAAIAHAQRRRRAESNARFLASRNRDAISNGVPRDGLLYSILDAFFRSGAQAAAMTIKTTLVLLSSILLCVRVSAGSPGGLTYAESFAPLDVVFALVFAQPLFARRWPALRAYSPPTPSRTLAIYWLAWMLPFLAFFILVAIRLDGN